MHDELNISSNFVHTACSNNESSPISKGKLAHIFELGFDDAISNREALIAANGDVHRAVAILLGCEDLI